MGVNALDLKGECLIVLLGMLNDWVMFSFLIELTSLSY